MVAAGARQKCSGRLEARSAERAQWEARGGERAGRAVVAVVRARHGRCARRVVCRGGRKKRCAQAAARQAQYAVWMRVCGVKSAARVLRRIRRARARRYAAGSSRSVALYAVVLCGRRVMWRGCEVAQGRQMAWCARHGAASTVAMVARGSA